MDIKAFTPTDEQREIATSKSRIVLVEALAGSGKTTTLSYCVAAAHQRKERPDSILVLVYSNEAKQVFKDRLRWIGIKSHIRVHTFNEYAEHFLLAAEKKGYISPVNVINADEKLKQYVLEAMNWVIEESNNQSDEEISNSNFHISQILECLDRLKGRMDFQRDFDGYTCDEIADSLGVTQTAFLICKRFENIRMLDEGTYSFRSTNDSVHDAICLLESYPETGVLLPELNLLVVDELHDINESQLRLINMLVKDHTRLVAMGDRDQVIYTSLGADPQYMGARFDQEFPKVKRYQLSESFRFGPSLACAISSEIKRECTSKQPKDTDIVTTQYNNDQDCAKKIAIELQDWLAKKNELSDCVIIVRDLAQTILIENALALNNIEYKPLGIEPYYERFEILMLRGLLHIALNNLFIVSDSNILKKIVRALGTYAELNYTESEWSEAENDLKANPDLLKEYFSHRLAKVGLDDNSISERAREWRSRFKNVALYLSDNVKSQSAGELLNYAVKELNLEATTKRLYVKAEDALNVTRNINGFISFACSSNMSCEDLLNEIERISQLRNLRSRSHRAVTLTTVEKSKGNEWKHVLIPYLERGKFPMFDANADEKRLFYVAISRAIDKLSLFIPSQEHLNDSSLNANSAVISHFVTDMDILNANEAGKKQLKRNVVNNKTEPILFLNVRYEEKDQVKKLGAKWDLIAKKWYIPIGNSSQPFKKWIAKKTND